MSFIVQLPLANSSRMGSVRGLLRHRSQVLWTIPFDDRPGKLFEGLQHCRSVVFLSHGGSPSRGSSLVTARYQRWATHARDHLFPTLECVRVGREPVFPGHFPKYAGALEESAFAKLTERGTRHIGSAVSRWVTEHFVFYQEATGYWVKASVGLPYYAKNGVVEAPAHGRFMYFDDEETAYRVCALLSSSLFYAYFIAYGDCFHLSEALAHAFPVDGGLLGHSELLALSKRLMADLRANSGRETINTRDGDEITYEEFYGWKSKPIIDEIDRVLARHYGFTEEELDFIINYDIKYRMGRDGSGEGE